MKDSKAIEILQLQIDKLKNDVANRSYNWTNETRAYIIDFFGEESSQNEYFRYFNTWWVLVPSISDTPSKTIEQQEKDVVSFLESCISVIKNIGIAKKPKQNFLHQLPNEILGIILTALVGGGILIGRYLYSVENIRLENKIETLEKEVKNYKDRLIKAESIQKISKK